MSIKIAVGGCRDFDDCDYIFRCLDEYLSGFKHYDIIFISGHCSGVDAIAEKYAAINKFEVILFPANWGKYGRAAGPIRNKKMVEEADIVIAFWDERSRGTKSLINLAKKLGKKFIIFKI